MCIDAEMKNKLNAASGNGIDSGVGVLWYGEVSWATSSQIVVVQDNLNAQRYVNFLNNILLPFMQNFGPGLTFQYDNARPHNALITANFLAQNNANV